MKLAFALPLVMASAVCLAAPGANATVQTFVVPLLGTNEVPAGSGDLDGFGTATLLIDDVALTIDWNISVSNIDTVILDHIHSGAAGTNGPVIVDFSGQLSGTGLADPDLASVLANPTAFYVNVHTNTFTGGAIRGQVPEPTTALLVTAGLAILAGSVRRYRH